MSGLNIGNAGYEAVEKMRSNEPFVKLLGVLEGVASQKMNAAIESDDRAVVAAAYARGVRDVYLALRAAFDGVQIGRVQAPGLPKQNTERK